MALLIIMFVASYGAPLRSVDNETTFTCQHLIPRIQHRYCMSFFLAFKDVAQLVLMNGKAGFLGWIEWYNDGDDQSNSVKPRAKFIAILILSIWLKSISLNPTSWHFQQYDLLISTIARAVVLLRLVKQYF